VSECVNPAFGCYMKSLIEIFVAIQTTLLIPEFLIGFYTVAG